MKQHLLGILLAVAVCFGANLPAQAQNTKDIVDRLETALGVSLPSPYRAKFKEFVATNKIMRDEGSNAFTEKFIKDQMKTNLGINRRNQFLLVWNAIYHAIKNDYIYDGSDGNETILDDYNKVVNAIEACEDKYRKDYSAYTKRRLAEAERRSAEAERRSAEADQERVVVAYHNLYMNTDIYTMRNNARESEIKQVKENFKLNIKNFEEFKIDFQSFLPAEVQRFYGLNPVQQNSLTCDKAKVQILNIVLQEIVKLYNIYQKAPQAKREIIDIKDYIKDCKKHNIDYKSKFSPEVRRFFGVE